MPSECITIAPDDGFAAVLPLGGSERQGGAGDRGKHWDWLRDSQGVGWHGRAHSDRLPQRAESARGDRIIGASLNLHARHMPVMDCASLHDDASAVMLPSPVLQAVSRLKEEASPQQSGQSLHIEAMPLDLASFRSTRSFTDAFKQRNLPLHILVNNAGVAFPQQLGEEAED